MSAWVPEIGISLRTRLSLSLIRLALATREAAAYQLGKICTLAVGSVSDSLQLDATPHQVKVKLWPMNGLPILPDTAAQRPFPDLGACSLSPWRSC